MASIERYDKEFPKLKDFNLYAAVTSGAGNCLFHALSDQLYGHEQNHLEIRNRCVAYLRQHADYFKPFVDVDSTTRSRPKRSTRGACKKDSDGYSQETLDRAYEDRLNKMGELGVYGDNLEIQAFAREFAISVKLYQRKNILVITPWGETASHVAGENCVHIARHDWEHYSSVRNRTGPHDGLPQVHPIDIPLAVNTIIAGIPYGVDTDTVIEALEHSQFDVAKAKAILYEKAGHVMLPSPPDSQADTPREVYTSSEIDACADLGSNSGTEGMICSELDDRYTPESMGNQGESGPDHDYHDQADVMEEDYQETSTGRKRSRSSERARQLDNDEHGLKRPRNSETSTDTVQPTMYAVPEEAPSPSRQYPECTPQAVLSAVTPGPIPPNTTPTLSPSRGGLRIQDLIHPIDVEPPHLTRTHCAVPPHQETVALAPVLNHNSLHLVAEPQHLGQQQHREAKRSSHAPPKKQQPQKKAAPPPPPSQPTRRSRRLQAKAESVQHTSGHLSTPPSRLEALSPPDSPLSSVPSSPAFLSDAESIGSTIFVSTPAPSSRQKTINPTPVVIPQKPNQGPLSLPPGQEARKVIQPQKQAAKAKPRAMKSGSGNAASGKRRTTYGMKQNNFRVIYV